MYCLRSIYPVGVLRRNAPHSARMDSSLQFSSSLLLRNLHRHRSFKIKFAFGRGLDGAKRTPYAISKLSAKFSCTLPNCSRQKINLITKAMNIIEIRQQKIREEIG